MCSLNDLPVVDITQENCAEHWGTLLNSIRTCTFIAIDIVCKIYYFQFSFYNNITLFKTNFKEMSGLGNRKNLTLQYKLNRPETILNFGYKYSFIIDLSRNDIKLFANWPPALALFHSAFPVFL